MTSHKSGLRRCLEQHPPPGREMSGDISLDFWLHYLLWFDKMSRATSLALLHVCGGTKCIEKYKGIIMWLCPAVRLLKVEIGKSSKIVLETHWAEDESFTHLLFYYWIIATKLPWYRNPLTSITRWSVNLIQCCECLYQAAWLWAAEAKCKLGTCKCSNHLRWDRGYRHYTSSLSSLSPDLRCIRTLHQNSGLGLISVPLLTHKLWPPFPNSWPHFIARWIKSQDPSSPGPWYPIPGVFTRNPGTAQPG